MTENHFSFDDYEIIDCDVLFSEEYKSHINLPDVANPIFIKAKAGLETIKKILCSSPAFIEIIKASVPGISVEAILTDEQKKKIASGALRFMTKKDGSLTAKLVNPKTGKIVETIDLKQVSHTPELSKAMTDYATQMQLAQLAEQIQLVQIAVEEVRQGQEFDRLATAFSCQQKYLQAMRITNPKLRSRALLQLAFDCEDSRNLLMQSQTANIEFIREQPESFWGKFFSGANTQKIDSRINEIRGSLCAINMVSLTEALSYQEMGETESAYQSLEYYAQYINKTYLEHNGFVQRLDMIDPSPINYWSNTLPQISEKIKKLSSPSSINLLEE